ncbi:hypothetical protein BDV59DRAFT_154093 [Aspergillus ambiguus]|uniref:uncharacterized protein n=1 Tax=Aspergillus ambiguus TaxID=176160 RepID=UPI003CCD5F10
MRLSTLPTLTRHGIYCRCPSRPYYSDIRRLSTAFRQSYGVPVGGSGDITVNVVESASASTHGHSNVIIHLPPGPLFKSEESDSIPDAQGEDMAKPEDLHMQARTAKIPRSMAKTTQATIVTINYRLGRHHQRPGHSYQYPIPVHDTLAGFDWVLQNLRPARLGIIGGHIGGSLALMLALTEPQSVNAVAALEPVCDWPGLDEYCKQKAETDSQATLKGRKPARTRCAPWDLVPLLKARNTLFSTPERYFDAFASPILFLRSPGKDVPSSFPKYMMGEEHPIPVLKQLPDKEIGYWDVHEHPDEGYETGVESLTHSTSEVGSDAKGHIVHRRKALSRWPPYGIDNGTQSVSSGHYHRGMKRPQVELPWVRLFVRTEPGSVVSPRRMQTRKPPSVLASQANEMVDVMRRACFWNHEMGVSERRVTIDHITPTEWDGTQVQRAREWVGKMLKSVD